MRKLRDVSYDFIRVIAMLLVVAVHSSQGLFSNNRFLSVGFNSVVFACNGLFYMLSGKFNLSVRLETSKDYFLYYKKKFVSIIIPYVSITIALYLYDNWINNHQVGIKNLLISVINNLMGENTSTHLWFMYPLIGMILSAPFLAKMVQSMTVWEHKLLFILGICWNVISVYLTKNLGIQFSYSGWILSSWIFHFYLGYYCDYVINEQNKNYYYLMGCIGILVTIICTYFSDHYFNAYDLAPAHVFYVMGLYVFLKTEIKVLSKRLQRFIVWIAKHSFMIYLIHYPVRNQLISKFLWLPTSWLKFGMRFIVCVIVSVIIAAILNVIIFFPLQKQINRMIDSHIGARNNAT